MRMCLCVCVCVQFYRVRIKKSWKETLELENHEKKKVKFCVKGVGQWNKLFAEALRSNNGLRIYTRVHSALRS